MIKYNIGDIIMFELPYNVSDERIYFLVEGMDERNYLVRNLGTGEIGKKGFGIDMNSLYKKAA